MSMERWLAGLLNHSGASLAQLSAPQPAWQPQNQPARGLLDIDTSRPILENKDGSFSTERTITIEAGGKHYLIPTIIQGVQVPERAAIMLWQAGDNKAVGVFDNADEAERAAVERSKRIGELRQKDRRK